MRGGGTVDARIDVVLLKTVTAIISFAYGARTLRVQIPPSQFNMTMKPSSFKAPECKSGNEGSNPSIVSLRTKSLSLRNRL